MYQYLHHRTLWTANREPAVLTEVTHFNGTRHSDVYSSGKQAAFLYCRIIDYLLLKLFYAYVWQFLFTNAELAFLCYCTCNMLKYFTYNTIAYLGFNILYSFLTSSLLTTIKL